MNKSTGLRYKASLEFLKKHISFDDVITELGERNNLTELLLSEGYRIVNTSETSIMALTAKLMRS